MYTIDYFINKFELIPSERMVYGQLDNGFGGHCANGWLGVRNINKPTEEGKAIKRLLENVKITRRNWYLIPEYAAEYDYTDHYSNILATVNNGPTLQYEQSTPKERVLALLYDVKNGNVTYKNEEEKEKEQKLREEKESKRKDMESRFIIMDFTIGRALVSTLKQELQEYADKYKIEAVPKADTPVETTEEEKVPAPVFVEKLLSDVFSKQIKESEDIVVKSKEEVYQLESVE